MPVSHGLYWLRNRIIDGGAWGLRVLPWSWVIVLGRVLGWLGYVLVKKRREIALNNLRAVYGKQWSESKIRSVALLSFQHLLVTALETIRMPAMQSALAKKYQPDWEKFYALQSKIRSGQGILMLVPHMGNWELGGAWLAAQGIPLAVVAREQAKDPYINNIIDSARQSVGMTVIHKKNALPAVVRLLRQGYAVVILMDQHVHKEKVEVPFMGLPASSLASPALLARRLQVPVLVVYTWRDQRWRPGGSTSDWIPIQVSDDDEDDLIENTLRFNTATEAAINKHPEQWMWMHRRWRELS